MQLQAAWIILLLLNYAHAHSRAPARAQNNVKADSATCYKVAKLNYSSMSHIIYHDNA